jgi:hypothetical protein
LRRRTLEIENKQNVIQKADILEFIKSFRLRYYDHVEKIQNQRMPKQIATFTKEGTRKTGRPRKRWADEFEEDLNIIFKKHAGNDQDGRE